MEQVTFALTAEIFLALASLVLTVSSARNLMQSWSDAYICSYGLSLYFQGLGYIAPQRRVDRQEGLLRSGSQSRWMHGGRKCSKGEPPQATTIL